MKLKTMIIMICALTLIGCAARPPGGYGYATPTVNYRPVVDHAKCQNCDYDRDLAECTNIAQNNTSYTANAIGGAAAGAGAAALIGAIIGADVGTAAAIGATTGGIGGLGNEAVASQQMVARCMAGRGYSVLR